MRKVLCDPPALSSLGSGKLLTFPGDIYALAFIAGHRPACLMRQVSSGRCVAARLEEREPQGAEWPRGPGEVKKREKQEAVSKLISCLPEEREEFMKSL